MGDNDNTTSEGLAGAGTTDPEAFAALLERVRGRLEMWISLRMGPMLRARLNEDDVMQETLLQAYRSLDGFRDGGPGSFQRWLFSVAENRLRDLHKYHAAQRREPGREARLGPVNPEETRLVEVLEATGRSPSSGAHLGELSARLIERIGRLPEDLRDVLVARAIEEQPVRVIAERLDKSEAAVRAQYARALKRLRDELGS